MNETERIYTTKEVARMCGVSRYRIIQAIHNREIDFLNFAQPGAKKPKMYRFTASAVDRWLHSIRNYAHSEHREPEKQIIL
jgi:excisionase family DNA binding protein